MPRDELLGELPSLPVYPGKRPLKTEQEPDRNSVTPPDETDLPWDHKPLTIMHKGQPQEFFTIGHLARAMGRKPVTIRSWEDAGWLPLSRFRTPPPKGSGVPGKAKKGRRLYTRHQVEVVIAAAMQTGALEEPRSADWIKFKTLVLAGWQREKVSK